MPNKDQKIHFTPRFLISAAYMILLIPIPWFVAWFIAVAVHECFHCIALLLCKQRISHIIIDISGAQIQTTPLSNIHTVICAVAGPAGSLLLVLFYSIYPQLALCALSQSLYNLLPIYPMDGGRVLYSAACLLLPEHTAKRICKAIAALVLAAGLIVSAIAAMFLNTCLPVLLAMTLPMQMLRNKNSLQIKGSQSTIVLPK